MTNFDQEKEVIDPREQLTRNILRSRYAPDAEQALAEYYQQQGSSEEDIRYLASQVHRSITHPLQFLNYTIPPELESNNEHIRNILLPKVQQLEGESTSPEQLKDFLSKHHEFIKYAQNQWLLANPGVILEIFKVSPNINFLFASELRNKYGVNPGDEVVHRHVISENGRRRLKNSGLEVPFEHWDRSYIVNALQSAASIIKSNPNNKGILAEGSWIYDPNNYSIAPDGKPFVSFDFLKDDKLVGHRIDLGEATDSQYSFSTRNERRRQFAEDGLYTPHVYGVFYPRDELLSNINILT